MRASLTCNNLSGRQCAEPVVALTMNASQKYWSASCREHAPVSTGDNIIGWNLVKGRPMRFMEMPAGPDPRVRPPSEYEKWREREFDL